MTAFSDKKLLQLKPEIEAELSPDPVPCLTKDDSSDSESDYTLNWGSCWITVENASIYIIKTETGVIVDIYARGNEADSAIGSTMVSFADCDPPKDE